MFHEVKDEILVFKGQFHIQLGKFRLAIGAQVFITEAAGHLEVSFQSGNHEELFEKLRGLRKGIEFARIYTAWYQVVSGAFRGALGEHRSFNFQKIIFIQECSHFMDNLMSHDEMILHFRTSQIDITIFQANIFIHINAVFYIEWRSLCLVQDAEFGNYYFHLAGLHFRVHGVSASFTNFAFHSQNVFASYTFRLVESFFTVLGT